MTNYTMSDVLSLCNIPHKRGTEIRIPCPFCGKKNKLDTNMGINMETQVYSCFSNPDHRGKFAVTFYAKYFGISNADAHKEICSQLGINPKMNYEHRTREIPKVEASVDLHEGETAPLDDRDKTYRTLFSMFTLDPLDKEELLNRGLTQEEIELLGYKSTTSDDIKVYFDITKRLEDAGCKLDGVAGFYRSKSKNYPMFNYYYKGIMVPYVSFEKKITSYQIRRRKEEPKYMWQTSVSTEEFIRINGVSPTGNVHYACDFAKDKDGNYYPIPKDGASGKKYMCITEGAMKADIAHCISGIPFIGVAGTNATQSLIDDLPRLKEIGVTDFLMCFDEDQLVNVNVLSSLNKLSNQLFEAGFNVQNGSVWNIIYKEYKGDYAKFDIMSDFVFTPETLQNAIADKRLSDILKSLFELGRTNIYFALFDNNITQEDRENYKVLLELAKERKFASCKFVQWKLQYKGIDDFYAGTERNIEYV